MILPIFLQQLANSFLQEHKTLLFLAQSGGQEIQQRILVGFGDFPQLLVASLLLAKESNNAVQSKWLLRSEIAIEKIRKQPESEKQEEEKEKEEEEEEEEQEEQEEEQEEEEEEEQKEEI
jgi:hypothetical protein